MSTGRRTAAALAAVLISGCVSLPDAVTLRYVSSFSDAKPGETLPPGWRPWLLSGFKRPTEYRLVNELGRTVVRARARNSASGLVHDLQLDPGAYPLLHWQWKVNELIARADNTNKDLEDSPVRLVVGFSGDVEKLDLGERIFFDNVRLLTGHQLPYATLMYIWENRAPKDSVIPNRHTSRIRMIVAESGRDKLGAWQQVTRNVVEDYRRVYGEEPGRITSIGIMTDTDNTGDNAHAWYGDIVFRRSTAPQTAAARQQPDRQ